MMLLRGAQRCFKSSWTNASFRQSRPGVEGYALPPLTEKLDASGEPVKPLQKQQQPASSSKTGEFSTSHIYDTHVTTLDNGLRVASEKLFGEFCTVGVIIDAGPRYETPFMSGTTHFLEKLAFHATSKYRHRENILDLFEKKGAICDCQSGRDAIIYALSCRRTGLPEILNLLSETLYRPIFDDEILKQTQDIIKYEIENLNQRPDPEPLLTDMLHKAAYGDGAPLANPKICPVENVSKMTASNLYTFMKHLYLPTRSVIACVGVDHDDFVQMTRQHFVPTVPVWQEHPTLAPGTINADFFSPQMQKSKWKGGSCLVEKDLSDLNQGSNNQLPELAHVVVGLESPAFMEERDFVASCVINTLMGGGGSFSAGGPGKGMYSRLYLNVLNKYHFMFSATAYNQSYVDTGVFCIHASAPPQFLEDMCHVIGHELVKMSDHCEKDELSRAKTQLQSMLFMNLEQRPVMFEDVARQVLSRGRREQAKYYYDRIEQIEESDILRVAKRMLERPPAVVALGRLGQVNPHDEIMKLLGSSSGDSSGGSSGGGSGSSGSAADKAKSNFKKLFGTF